jgi:hypothetical protein
MALDGRAVIAVVALHEAFALACFLLLSSTLISAPLTRFVTDGRLGGFAQSHERALAFWVIHSLDRELRRSGETRARALRSG